MPPSESKRAWRNAPWTTSNLPATFGASLVPAISAEAFSVPDSIGGRSSSASMVARFTFCAVTCIVSSGRPNVPLTAISWLSLTRRRSFTDTDPPPYPICARGSGCGLPGHVLGLKAEPVEAHQVLVRVERQRSVGAQ